VAPGEHDLSSEATERAEGLSRDVAEQAGGLLTSPDDSATLKASGDWEGRAGDQVLDAAGDTIGIPMRWKPAGPLCQRV
jgi:hypothetical protein